MRTVITYGTFDTLHFGHINLLRRAKELGDRLIVGLSTDEFNLVKKKESYHNYEQRRANLELIKCIDLIIPENNWLQKISDVTRHEVTTFCIGDDWAGKFDFLKPYCNVIYLPRTDNISTTIIKDFLR